ncbi:large conductance mechanosensitive channel protein MscL [Synechococcus sp. UW140]|uniref:large conductance mechanosensitive channel protein MscL n=1 Tax=Synechococcus sp. UW140 TaxID=368503 RepID=UPI000E0ECD81|nr:large conductance mechanosensitive channel protein MscL [Synechococcus sp. UW140]
MPRVPVFLSAFQAFISKGNVVDLGIAVIMAGAFSKVVNSVVTLLMTNILEPALKEANVESLAQLPAGEVLVALINFIVIALVCFILVKAVEVTKRKKESIEASQPDPQAQLASAMTRLTEVLEKQSSSTNT